MQYKLILDSARPFFSLFRGSSWCYYCVVVIIGITKKQNVVWVIEFIVIEFQEMVMRIIITGVVMEVERCTLAADHGESGEGHADDINGIYARWTVDGNRLEFRGGGEERRVFDLRVRDERWRRAEAGGGARSLDPKGFRIFRYHSHPKGFRIFGQKVFFDWREHSPLPQRSLGHPLPACFILFIPL